MTMKTTTCQRCGSKLKNGHCVDKTCPFSDHKQFCPTGWIGHPDRGYMLVHGQDTCVCNLTAAQRHVLQLLGRSGQMDEAELSRLCPRWRMSVRVLERKQLVSFTIRHDIVWYLTKKCTQSGIMADIMG